MNQDDHDKVVHHYKILSIMGMLFLHLNNYFQKNFIFHFCFISNDLPRERVRDKLQMNKHTLVLQAILTFFTSPSCISTWKMSPFYNIFFYHHNDENKNMWRLISDYVYQKVRHKKNNPWQKRFVKKGHNAIRTKVLWVI